MNTVLTPATPSDADFLCLLDRERRRAEFAPLDLPPPVLAQLLDLQYRAQVLGYAAQFPDASNCIVWHGDERAGRILVWYGMKEIHLVDVVLLEHYRGRGIGHGLLGGLCEQAAAQQLPLRLSVRVGNPAMRLYRRAGFLAVGDDGVDTAMEWDWRRAIQLGETTRLGNDVPQAK